MSCFDLEMSIFSSSSHFYSLEFFYIYTDFYQSFFILSSDFFNRNENGSQIIFFIQYNLFSSFLLSFSHSFLSFPALPSSDITYKMKMMRYRAQTFLKTLACLPHVYLRYFAKSMFWQLLH